MAAAAAKPVPFAAPDLGPEPTLLHWQQKLPLSPNYAQFVDEATGAAHSGDADAQFAMYIAFSFCRDGLRKRSAEEMRQFNDEIMTDMHRRCDALAAKYADLAGEADRWLALALDAKFPRALAAAARIDIEALDRSKVSGSERAKRLAIARSRLLTALRANDPGVTFVVPNTLHAFFPRDRRLRTAVSLWLLAACEQGLECGVNTPWMRDICNMRRDCLDGETGFQYARRLSGDFPSLLARARKLATMLRKAELGEAEFAETVTSLPVPAASVDDGKRAARLLH
ncbi:MAG TPA: hypothetical protein VGO61_05855 [Steroidobacteraceae bacterium]|nr:hypothetical protein [Steroidobacteraceae bacterium]